MPSSFRDVISKLERQKIAIERAIAALQDVGEEDMPQPEAPKRGRPTKAATKTASKKTAGKKSTLSPEARERISAAQRKRWAKQKKAAKKSEAE